MTDTLALATILPILPEIIVAVCAVGLLVGGVFSQENEEAAPTIALLAVFTLVGGIVALLFLPAGAETARGAFVTDSFARYLKILTLVSAAIVVIMTRAYARHQSFPRFEYP